MTFPSLRLAFGTAMVLAAWLSGAAQAATHHEATQGEVSDNPLAPTPLLLEFNASMPMPGGNVISGTVGRGANTPNVIDRDYLRVTVPTGHVWSALRVGNQVTNGGRLGSFIGLADGSTMPVSPTATSASGLLGWTLYTASQATTDILDDMALGHISAGGLNGASGFAAPLPAGDYTLWIQETASGSYTYRFNLVLTPVPEPAAAMLALAALGGLWAIRSRKARRGQDALR